MNTTLINLAAFALCLVAGGCKDGQSQAKNSEKSQRLEAQLESTQKELIELEDQIAGLKQSMNSPNAELPKDAEQELERLRNEITVTEEKSKALEKEFNSFKSKFKVGDFSP